ncbi:MAG: PKD domain-containing protein, partial [Terriglobales bacterium]
LEPDNGIAIAAGGGFDVNVHRNISLRLIQIDYMYAHHNFAPVALVNQNSARLRSGLVFLLGTEAPIPPSCSASASPGEVMAGEPVQVTASAANFPKNRALIYTWNASGGQVTGAENASVDTSGLAPGSYTVSARVSDNRKASADCSASFTVKEPPKRPPTITCSADPTTVQSGDASTLTCSCTSPDNRSLGYTWSTTGGRVIGTGNRVQLDTAGTAAGPITVSTTCTDDRGLSDSTRTKVNVEVPPPPPQAEKVAECAFTNKAKPARVDNACKATLDDVALRLQREADARAVIVGQADADERNAAKVAQQRADNSKAYLAKEKGIDPSRIGTRAGSEGGKSVAIWIVPTGATF